MAGVVDKVDRGRGATWWRGWTGKRKISETNVSGMVR